MVAGLSEATELSSDADSSTTRRFGLQAVARVRIEALEAAGGREGLPLLGAEDGGGRVVDDLLATGVVGLRGSGSARASKDDASRAEYHCCEGGERAEGERRQPARQFARDSVVSLSTFTAPSKYL